MQPSPHVYQQKQIARFRKRVLDRLQQFIRSDIRYLAKNGTWVGISHAIQIFTGILITVVLANTLSKESLGLYQFVISVGSVLSMLTLSGMGTAVLKATAQGDSGALRRGLHSVMLWNVGIVAASAAVSSYYFLQDNSTLALAFLLVGACAPFIQGFQLYQPYLIGSERFRLHTVLSILHRGIPLIAIVSVVTITQNPLWLIGAYFLSNTISVAFNYIIVRLMFRPSVAEQFTQSIRYSKHLSVMKLLGRAAEHADKILIFQLLGGAPAAIFTIAQLPTRYLKNSMNLFQPLVFPRFAKQDFTTLQQTLTRKVLLLALGVGVVVTAYVLLAPYLFAFIFSEYPEAVFYSQILALAALFVPRTIYMHALTAHEKTSTLYIVRVGLPILKIVLLFIFILLYGMWGAVAAILLERAIGTLVIYLLFRKQS